MQHWELLLFFLIIALVYASVGFGGGSSYLAVLALYPMLPFQEIKLTALLCNIIVVTGGTIIYIKNGNVNWRKILPLVLVSVPLAFLGAKMKINQDTFFIILGISLLIASVLLWVRTGNSTDISVNPKTSYVKDGLIGGAIGFLSGLVGIGGGIFLSPVLNLARWDKPKAIAATASVFILANSVSGIAGQVSHLPDNINYTRIGLLCLAVLTGGQIGSRLGAGKFNHLVVRRLTAALVFFAGGEVLFKHLHLLKQL